MRRIVQIVAGVGIAALAGTPVGHGMTQQRATEIVTGVSESCRSVAGNLAAKAQAAWSYPAACTTKEDAKACRKALVESIENAVKSALEQAAPGNKLRSQVDPTSLDPHELVSLQPALTQLDRAAADAGKAAVEAARKEAEEVYADFDPAADDAEARVEELAEAAFEAASEPFRTECGVATQSAMFAIANAAKPPAEQAHVDDLTKDTGFSPVVRCQWVRQQTAADRLDCKPGLRVGAQDPSTILIAAPDGGSVAWVRAVTAEEGAKKAPLDQLTCPGYGGNPDKLTCDTLCYAGTGGNGDCAGNGGVDQALIAVHVPRWFDTSWGCGWGGPRSDCTFNRLRGPDHREKLSLVLRGKSPVILVQARDDQGKVASGEILVGYERWRIETGGFLAVTHLVDNKLTLETIQAEETTESPGKGGQSSDAGKVRVAAIREEDNLAQETGIFLNLIPRNYELFGLGLGFATHDSRAPSLYAGPVVRIRTFGHRGIASLSAGYALRQVERFPELEARFPDLLELDPAPVFAPDAAVLQPELQWEEGWYAGVHLGFSFGPIGSADGNGD